MGEVEALTQAAPELAELADLLALLHPLGDHLKLQCHSQPDDGVGDGRILGPASNPRDEGSVDLQDVDGERDE